MGPRLAAAQEIHKTLDKKIDVLVLALLALKRRRNVIAHITLLPPDILRLIFEYATLTQERYYLPWELKWMRNTAHVCAYWRRVALDHAVLWSYISLNVPSWIVEEKLRRSKAAPLTIIIDMSCPYIKDLPYVWKNTARICDISIHAQSDYHNMGSSVRVHNTLPDIAAVAECLERFSLTFHWKERPNDILPLNIFAGGTPKLHELQLKRCGLNWNSPFLSGLISLSLDEPSSKDGRPPLAQLVSALDKMRNLKTLVLHNILLPVLIHAIPNRHRARVLPHLTSIDIISTTPECIRLIENFGFPSIASAKFELNSKDEDFEFDLPEIIKNVSGLATEDGIFTRYPIRSIECQYLRSYYGLEFKLWDVRSTQPYRLPGCPPRLQFGLRASGNNPQRWTVGTLGLLSEMLPLEEIQSLSISQLSYDDWILHIGQFKSLEWLRARDKRTSLEFMDVLCKRMPIPSC